MLKKLILIGLIITLTVAQPSDDILFGPDPLANDGEVAEVEEISTAEELVLDTTLPLAEEFVVDGEAQPLQVQPVREISHYIRDGDDGELTAEEHVEQSVNQLWEDHLFTFNNFADLFAFVQNHIVEEIQTIDGFRSAQAESCSGFQNDISRVESDISRIEGFISWMENRVNANEAQIEEIFDGRCRNHMNYLNFMKNSQITLRLLQFLRTALENYSFVQMKNVGEILTKYAKSTMANEEVMKVMLVELKDIQDRVAVRTAEEIGTGHIDEERDGLDLANQGFQRMDLGDYKVQLISIIEQIEADVNGEIERRQNDEVELNQRVIEWTHNLNTEIAEIQVHLLEEVNNLQSANNDLQTFIYESETCNAQLQWFVDQITALQAYLDYLTANGAEVEAKYNEERDKYVLSATLNPN